MKRSKQFLRVIIDQVIDLADCVGCLSCLRGSQAVGHVDPLLCST